jgi:hypothetical protein
VFKRRRHTIKTVKLANCKTAPTLQTDELKNKNYHNSSLFTIHYSLKNVPVPFLPNRSCDGKNNEEGFSGADIEYVVRSALCNSILEADSRDNKSINLNNVTPSVGDIIKEIRNIKGKAQRDRMDEYCFC